MNNLLNKLKNFFVIKDIKEKNRLALIEEVKMNLNALKERKMYCDMFDAILHGQSYNMYTFMQDTNKSSLKAELLPKFVELSFKYSDLKKVFVLLKKIEENLNKLIEIYNNKEENNSEFKEFVENVNSEINTLEMMFANLAIDKKIKEFMEITELMGKNINND